MSQTTKLDETITSLHRERMQDAGLPEVAIRAFLRSLRFVFEGGSPWLPESEIAPVESLPGLPDLDRFDAEGHAALSSAVVLKLNGGLGTSMGLTQAKSLLPVRPGLSFLDLIARQVRWQREHWQIDLPLVLMNSFRTRAASLAALEKHVLETPGIPLDFVQSKVPRVDPDSGRPIEWPDDPELEWCPPGHGDLYVMLEASGMLERLRARGIRYAFVSNADNLGAVLDRRLLGWFAASGRPFAMEVAERTPSDKKGGHLARLGDGLVLREKAQCPEADVPAFEDVTRHRYFNTNNLWLDLDALAARLAASPDGLPLAVIRNEKPVSPDQPEGPRCLQLETAMGAAIACFEDAAAICVPRERFAPVKTTNDLLLLWSDAYEITDDARIVATENELHRTRRIDLDPRYYGRLGDLEARFAMGAPSLRACRRLRVEGDHRFGAGVTIEGDVELVNASSEPVEIPDGSRLGGSGPA